MQGRPAEWRTRSVSLRPKCIRPAPIESAGAQRASGRRAAAGSRRTSQRDGGGGDDGEQRRSSQPSKSRCLFTVDAFTDPAGFRLETRVLARTLSLATLSAARHRHNPARHARPRCAHRTSKGSVYERVDGWAGLWVGLLKQEAGHGEARLRRRRPCCAQTASCACPRRRRTSRCAASRPAARAQSRAAPRVHCSVGCIYPEAGPATPDAYACWNTFRCAQPRPHMQDACPAVHLRVSGSPSPHPRHAFAPRLPVGPN